MLGVKVFIAGKGHYAQRGVTVEAAPPATFVMTEADLLFELLIIAFDAPAQFDGVDMLIERDVGRQSREPVFGRFGFALGPFDN